jgi:hypothetical protein
MNKFNRYLPKEQDYIILLFWLFLLYLVYLQNPTEFSRTSEAVKHFLITSKVP